MKLEKCVPPRVHKLFKYCSECSTVIHVCEGGAVGWVGGGGGGGSVGEVCIGKSIIPKHEYYFIKMSS